MNSYPISGEQGGRKFHGSAKLVPVNKIFLLSITEKFFTILSSVFCVFFSKYIYF